MSESTGVHLRRSARRRHALRWMSVCAVALLPLPAAPEGVQRVAVAVIAAPDSAVSRGTRLGLEEATRAAAYFGYSFEPVEDEQAELVIAGVSDRKTLEKLAIPGRLLVNALASERGPCLPGLFHTAPSDSMLKLARAKAPEGTRIESWHASLVRFAARDLNLRYTERFQEPMTSDAWAGWVAARSLGDAVLRAQTSDVQALTAYFLGAFAVDGQKGHPLRFGADHQLRHPLYSVSVAGEMIGEMTFEEVVGTTLGDEGCLSGG